MNWKKLKLEEALHKTNGTSFQDLYLKHPYQTIVEIFGEPTWTDTPGDKVTCEWVIESEEGIIATIYDYQSWVKYTKNKDWHVGGFTEDAKILVQNIMNEWQENQ